MERDIKVCCVTSILSAGVCLLHRRGSDGHHSHKREPRKNSDGKCMQACLFEKGFWGGGRCTTAVQPPPLWWCLNEIHLLLLLLTNAGVSVSLVFHRRMNSVHSRACHSALPYPVMSSLFICVHLLFLIMCVSVWPHLIFQSLKSTQVQSSR